MAHKMEYVITHEPSQEQTINLGFRLLGPTKTELYKHRRRRLEIFDLGRRGIVLSV